MNEKRVTPPFTILTHENGTKTLVDTENGQAMHSRVGPVDEARKVYADLAKIEDRLASPTTLVRLFDVGMGTAANVVATLEKIQERPGAAGTLEVFSFEVKPEGLDTALESEPHFPWLGPWKPHLKTLLDSGEVRFKVRAVEIHWKLFVGDFYTHYPKLPVPDFIYFDFYSPRVVPELWSLEKFKELRAFLVGSNCQIFTYSASTPTRMNFLIAGFFVGKGTSTLLKHDTTVATIRFEDLLTPLKREWFEHKLNTSTTLSLSPDLKAISEHSQWFRSP